MKILGIGVDVTQNKRIQLLIKNKDLILLFWIISTPIPKIFIFFSYVLIIVLKFLITFDKPWKIDSPIK